VERATVPAVSPFADTVGYCRAVRVDPGDWEAVGRAHGELFGEHLPASAMLVIAGMLDPSWKVEIEADALLPE